MQEEQRSRRGVESSIRTAAVWEVIDTSTRRQQEELGRPLRVLDLGGGSGGFAVPLAERGHDVVVVDPSPDALASLDRRAGEAGVGDRVHGFQGDATSLASVVPEPVDLICCHGVLEYVDDAGATIAMLRGALAPAGVVSLLVAQRLAAVLSRALAGQFEAARTVLVSPDGRWGPTDPLPRRFDVEQIHAQLVAGGLKPVATQGVRVFADLVPSAYLDSEADRTSLLELEAAVAEREAAAFLGRLGAGLHVLAVRDG
ncbi:methyltransferase domain-containing protein [Mobilicoccus caccae]|uniref:Methyltransferase n=1 Tax=Mobilicoccus caccae TaxID=1859295 RepID=A0ABQ6IQR8_9MICO|nr:methyltransferase [Mobilicoccus caccae]GMA39799.1 methyltransferase [Mobilicoccus caccae]